MTRQELVPVAAPPQPPRAPVLVRVLWWLLRGPVWWLLRRTGRVLWRYRDLHATWWAALVVLGVAAIGAGLGVPWWAAGGWVLVAAAARAVEARYDWLPVEPDALAGVLVAAGAWTAAALYWGLRTEVWYGWAGLTLLVFATWGCNRAARAWRSLRTRVRNWAAALPTVLAGLGAAGVVLAARPAVLGDGRVRFPLRLPVGITRETLEAPRMRRQIESGMHWPAGSIREIVQDPAHTSSARVVLVWQDGKIQARHVRLDLRRAPTSIYDPVWCGEDADGKTVAIAQYVVEGMTRGLFGGEPGSAKSNLLRLIAALRAYCPDLLIWVIDRKNSGLTFASLLPRIDWIATTREEAIRMLEAAAAGIPLRGRLLRPQHNQLLPLSPEVPAVLILFDEFAEELGKGRQNAGAVQAAKTVFSQGRATGWGAEIASQYLSQTSLHPDLKPLFPRSYAGRTRTRADAQFLLRDYTRVDATALPTGAFYTQVPGGSHPGLLFTPEVCDADLLQAAAETAHLAPRMEESTAAGLPHYADRWSRLPEHLRAYASEEQLALADAGPLPSPTGRVRTAAASTMRLVVHEQLPDDVVDNAAGDGGEELDDAIVAMLDVLRGKEVATTGELDAAVARWRSRQWASERRREWQRRGLIGPVGRGSWSLQVQEEGALREGVAEAERAIRSRRSSPRGGDRL
ncbi:hypothetical protein GCM10009555_017130 [Acrocarpospora macrocephala]|uniref:FtsK domain-containing protein n=1 Tax=Acrocarpospora macrocephala TaxID=150177 RepID=A0A5M3WJZ9_9ACTN|nr:hypothetical protein [Acrocarpospora macrocephala]GES07373.1 hypothetical protein Amac_009680 [Acrocarpospora macrocephala]